MSMTMKKRGGGKSLRELQRILTGVAPAKT